MSRYRKIEVKTWTDKRFRALSAMPPSGQGLWFFLLTGPHTGPIPGLFRAGRASMAEELGWEQEAFDEAFAEVFANGMAKADFKARLVWLPNAIKYNRPESPNVVRSWRAELDLLPECALKTEAVAAMRTALAAIGAAYAEAFNEFAKEDAPPQQAKAPAEDREESLPKPSGKAFGKASAKPMPNQEQEQEQEQEQVNPIVEQPQLDLAASPTKADDPVKTIFAYWQKTMDSPKSVLDDNRRKLIAKALRSYSPAEVCKAIRGCSKSPHNMGQNDRNTKFNGLGLILRDAEHIDRFIGLDNGQARAGAESIEQTNARVMAELLGSMTGMDDNTIEMEAS
ncbi:MAG: hypothetical protein K2X55_28075 [Burkholderiaceae bacterium]|nr:hypothetical protein [Burkholderiaceae bacterium]